jgi:uncharacterized protein
MEIACNYSLPLMRLITAGTAHVDWIKLSRREVLEQETAAVDGVRPILLHTLHHLGMRSLLEEGQRWPEVTRLLRRARSPHVATHLAFHPADSDGEPGSGPIHARIVANIHTLQAELPVPVLLENQPFYNGHGTARLTVDPAFIRSVAEETDTGLLLDTAHVRVAAAHLDLDARDYLRFLPLDRVREVHVAGPRVTAEDGLADRHFELLEEDYAFLAEALELTAPRILTLEYGGTGPRYETPERNSPEALQRQLQRLERIARGAVGV